MPPVEPVAVATYSRSSRSFSFGSWQAFALDRQERVELRVPTAFDNQDRTTRLGSQVDGSSVLNFVANFGAKLDSAPPV